MTVTRDSARPRGARARRVSARRGPRSRCEHAAKRVLTTIASCCVAGYVTGFVDGEHVASKSSLPRVRLKSFELTGAEPAGLGAAARRLATQFAHHSLSAIFDQVHLPRGDCRGSHVLQSREPTPAIAGAAHTQAPAPPQVLALGPLRSEQSFGRRAPRRKLAPHMEICSNEPARKGPNRCI